MKSASPKAIERVRKFFNRENVYRQLCTAVSFLVPHRSDVKLILNVGGGSYTDGNSVTLGLPEMFIDKSYAVIYTVLRALAGHETQHINSSDFVAYEQFQKDMGKYLFDKYKIPVQYGEKVAGHIGNSVEDGRIEKILCNRLPGYLKRIQFLNGSFWEEQPVKGNTELGDFLYSVTVMSVLGLYPKGFDDIYKGTEMHENLKKIRPDIIRGINAVSCKQCLMVCQEIIESIEDYLVPLLQNQSREDQEFLNNMPKRPEFTTSEETQQNASRTISTHFKPEQKSDSDKKDGENGKGENGEENDEGKKDGQESKGKDDRDGSDSKDGKGKPGKQDSKDEAGDGKGSSKENQDKGNDSASGGDKKDDSADGSEKKDENGKSASGKGDGDKKDGSGEKDDSANGDSSQSGGKGDKDGQDGKDGSDSDSDGSDGSKGDSKDGKSDKKDSKDDEGDPASQHPKGTDRDDDDDSVIDEEAIRRRMEEITDDVVEEANKQIRESGVKEKSSSKKEDEHTVSPEELKEIENTYRNQVVKRFTEMKGFNGNYPLPAEIKQEGKKFRKEVEKIFRNKESYTLRGQKKGVLDTSGIWKFGVRDYSMFVKKGAPVTTDYVAFLLQDGSGSMYSDNKEFLSAKALSVLEEGLKGIVPFKVSTFSVDGRENCVVHYTAKDFNDNSMSKNYSYSFHRMRRASGGNKDGYSIRVATAELLKRPEKDRILIVLSDGLPSDYNGGETEGMVDVKQAVKEARAKGIHVVSLIFGTESFRDYNIENYKYMYEKNVLSCNPEEITNRLVKTLKKIISR